MRFAAARRRRRPSKKKTISRHSGQAGTASRAESSQSSQVKSRAERAGTGRPTKTGQAQEIAEEAVTRGKDAAAQERGSSDPVGEAQMPPPAPARQPSPLTTTYATSAASFRHPPGSDGSRRLTKRPEHRPHGVQGPGAAGLAAERPRSPIPLGRAGRPSLWAIRGLGRLPSAPQVPKCSGQTANGSRTTACRSVSREPLATGDHGGRVWRFFN